MNRRSFGVVVALAFGVVLTSPAWAGEVCEGFGPQTPRDISNKAGTNPVTFAFAPPPSQLNLCNIHFHKNAEHKGPGFSKSAGSGEFGGFACNDRDVSPKALRPPKTNACENVAPGDTIEVHWVFSSCDVAPGPTLGACLSKEKCNNPQLRVETQVFLVVNDDKAEDFLAFDNAPKPVDGKYQPHALPAGTGEPVTFLGSTTGPKFTDTACSPLQVTWSVRPQCATVDINTLSAWCSNNARRADGVRQLVTDPRLLSAIH